MAKYGIVIGIIGLLTLGLIMGCTTAPAQITKTEEPATTAVKQATVEYEFFNRGQTNQEETETIIGSVMAGSIVVSAGYPKSMLVNYIYRGKCIYFPLNTKTDAEFVGIIKSKPKVCFAVDKYTALYWWGANIFGNAHLISDKKEIAKWLKEYESSYGKGGFNYPDEKGRTDTIIVKVVPEFISGRKMADPQNQNFAVRLPWMSLSHNVANMDVPAQMLPVTVTEVTLAKEVVNVGLPLETIESVLKGVGACRFNMLDSEYPYSVPMSVMTYKDGKVIMHSNKKGQKMECLAKSTKASLDYQWFWNNSSWIAVNLEGDIKIIETAEEIAQVLGEQDNPERFNKMVQRISLLVFTPKKITSKKIDSIPDFWYPSIPGTRTY